MIGPNHSPTVKPSAFQRQKDEYFVASPAHYLQPAGNTDF
ncbi:hypothetical protein C4K25_3878 [Pseudomonas chlororaphis]|nr:hypothetical protein C4K25_3878 [Pseudomonas chlororaphis]